jgi:hypothetical protein
VTPCIAKALPRVMSVRAARGGPVAPRRGAAARARGQELVAERRDFRLLEPLGILEQRPELWRGQPGELLLAPFRDSPAGPQVNDAGFSHGGCVSRTKKPGFPGFGFRLAVVTPT